MPDWYDDDSFWETFRGFMFNAARLEAAPGEVDRLIDLLALKPGAHVLDLCCGVGRHSLEFARRGFAVTGVDRTESYLQHAREVAAKENLQVEFIKSDARNFSRKDSFDAAINMFTSFGYFEAPGDELRVARNVFESLHPGAKFLIDVLGKEVLAARFRPFDGSRTPDGALMLEERRIVDGWSRIQSRWTYIDQTKRRESTLKLRLYSGSELIALMKQAGFSSAEVYGSLAAAPYDHRAERLIAVAQK